MTQHIIYMQLKIINFFLPIIQQLIVYYTFNMFTYIVYNVFIVNEEQAQTIIYFNFF